MADYQAGHSFAEGKSLVPPAPGVNVISLTPSKIEVEACQKIVQEQINKWLGEHCISFKHPFKTLSIVRDPAVGGIPFLTSEDETRVFAFRSGCLIGDYGDDLRKCDACGSPFLP